MKLSVIIPCYNAAVHLERAVNSVLAQGVAESEIIVVDDASTDDTVVIAERLARCVPDFRLIRLAANGGCGPARNAGLAEARGQYVAFLDADDGYEERALARAIARLDAWPWADAVTFAVRLVDCHREVHPRQLALIESSLPANFVIRRDFVRRIGGFPVDRSFMQGIGGEDIAVRNAMRLWGTIAHLPDAHLLYTVHRGSHFDRFLDSTSVVGDTVAFASRGEIGERADAAHAAHLQRVDAMMLAEIGKPRLHALHGDINGRRFDFVAPDRPEEIGRATALLRNSDGPALPALGPLRTILDAGAESGAGAIRLACQHPAARVVALEPARRHFVLLRFNGRAHPNLESYPVGLLNATATTDLRRDEVRERVLMVEPEAFFHSLRLDHLDVIRIDTAVCGIAALLAMPDRVRAARAIIVNYRSDADRRLIDGLLSGSHMLAWARSVRPHHGELLYVQSAFFS